MQTFDNNSIVAGFDDERNESLSIILGKNEAGLPSDGGAVLFIHLNGYIDSWNTSFLVKKVESTINAGFNKIVFCCAQLNYAASTAVGAFAGFLKTLKARGGDMVMVDVQPNVFEVFQLLGFSKFFNVKQNMEEVKNYLTK